MSYQAKVLLDSITSDKKRLTTMQITYPRFVHSEFMTHRVFSRNASSSRAIPVAKMLERVKSDPAMPVEWGLNQAGMQAEAHAQEDLRGAAISEWLLARDSAVRHAEELMNAGFHKQIVNRLIEPFTWITVIVSGTDYKNFFLQRATVHSPLAQPELRKIADMMLEAYTASTPTQLDRGEWHTPFIQADEDFNTEYHPLIARKRVSVARCARVSYLTQEGVRDHTEDLRLYQRLTSSKPIHASPLEHVATPSPPGVPVQGNFTGWYQMRHYDGF